MHYYTKPLSSLLTSCLTTVLIHYKEYCGGIFTNTGINCFWVINNLQSVIYTINAIQGSQTCHPCSMDSITKSQICET